jgi:hypothetical protein
MSKHKPFYRHIFLPAYFFTGGCGWYKVKKLAGLMPMPAMIKAVKITGV